MRKIPPFIVVVGEFLLMLSFAGCAPPAFTPDQRMDILLREKRHLEEQVRQRELRIAELSDKPSITTSPQESLVQAEQDPFRAVALRFNRHTAGVNIDGRPGDDHIKVILQPLDAEGDAVKRIGSVRLEIFTVASDRNERVGIWEFTTDQMSRHWLTGPLGLYGYVLRLDWPKGKPPAHNTLNLQARFRTLDGRELKATTIVKIDIGA